MASLKHQVWINAPIDRVFEGLETAEGLGKWWAPHATVQTDQGTCLTHSPGPLHGDVYLLIEELNPNKAVQWKVVSTHPSQSPASAWTGTTIRFSLDRRATLGEWAGFGAEPKEFTVLEFEHSGWSEDSPFLGFCNFAWGETLLMFQKWCESE